MAARTTLRLAFLCLSLALPALAQRGESSRPAPSPRPSPSAGASSRPAPSAPRPSAQPAPSRPSAQPQAPRPPVSAPAPRPSAPRATPQDAPRSSPSRQQPTPRSQPQPSSRSQPQPSPRSQPSPSPSSRASSPRPSAPTYNPPARNNPGRATPPARTTNRSDDRSPGRSAPPPAVTPRYQPPANDSAPVGRPITRPTVDSPSARPVPRSDGNPGQPRPRGGAADSRYRPAPSPVRDVVRDTVRDTDARDVSGRDAPGRVVGRDGAVRGGAVRSPGVVGNPDARDVAAPVARPRSNTPPASTRYRPGDTTPVARPGAARPIGGGAARPVTSRPSTPAVVAPVVPRLTGRSSVSSGVVGPRSSWSGGGYWGHRDRHHHHHHHGLWRSYWNPWHCHSWSSWHHWNWHCGSGWSITLWNPYWSYRSHYWHRSYHDTFWCSWSRPYCVSSSYWWYPTSVYCPTYLTVPSVVYVTESAPAPAAVGTEVVVAGGGVVGSARAVDVGPGTEPMTTSLAAKYVELGDFYFKANRFRDAAEAYGKARSYAPDDASVHFVLADAVFADGDFHYAAFLIAEGLRLDPAMASAETDKRTFYSEVKLFEDQMAALDAYLAKAPYDAQAHFVRGYNLRFSGKPADALAAFRRVLEIEPDHRGARTFVAALEPKPADDRSDR